MSLSIVASLLYEIVDTSFKHFHKPFFYIAMLTSLIVLFQKRFILNDWFIKVLILYSIFIVIFGLISNPINKATFAHFLPLTLPIIGISYGYFIAKSYQYLLEYFYNKMKVVGISLFVLTTIYYILYKLDMFDYFGASTLIVLPLIWALQTKKYNLLFLFFLALLFSGKRSTLLAFIIIAMIYLFINNKKSFLLLLTTISIFGMIGINKIQIFSRLVPIVNSLSTFPIDLVNLNKATSGRINDFIGAFNSVNESFFFWIFGKGLGSTFDMDAITYTWTTHYCHFTPMSYIFLGGIILFFIIYAKIIPLVFYSVKNINNFYCSVFLYYFIMSLIGGAIYFTDPFVWFITGIVIFIKKNDRKINVQK